MQMYCTLHMFSYIHVINTLALFFSPLFIIQIRINVPSYCDRVLWRSYPGTSIVNTSYGCTTDIMTSDHSPVFATFQIGGFKQYVSDAATPGIGLSTNNKAQIVIDRCQAKVSTLSGVSYTLVKLAICYCTLYQWF